MSAAAVLPCVIALPLLLALALPSRRLRAGALALAPWAALPGLAVALAGWPTAAVELPWLLVGTRLGLDPVTRVFLFLTAALWLVAGHYAAAYHARDPRRVRLHVFFLVTLAGNLLLVLAADAVTFYLGFLTMSLAAYGLIVHADTPEARRAGRVYIVLVVLGEALILPALWLGIVGAASTALADMAASIRDDALARNLLLAGFGIKAALVPLHVWLPLAHPVAPTPASAVLSGAMVKAGILGWLGLLPADTASLPATGAALVVLGLAGAFGGALVGCAQTRAKAVLAYSTVSQMGLVIAAYGMALLATPAAAAPALTALTVYVVHHAFAKGALFLGVGCVQGAVTPRARRLALALTWLPMLALAGAPLTSGALAKAGLKEALPGLPEAWYAGLDLALPLAALGTTLLMARFWHLTRRLPADTPRPGLFAPWLVLLLLVALACLLPWLAPGALREAAYDPTTWWSAAWPVLLGATLAFVVARHPPRLPALPEGDILWPVLALGRALVAHAARAGVGAVRLPARAPAAARLAWRRVGAWLDTGERGLTRWSVLGGAMLGAIALGWLLASA